MTTPRPTSAAKSGATSAKTPTAKAGATSKPAPEPCACATIRAASRSLARAYEAVLHPSALNTTQLAALRAIEAHPDEPLVRVAEALSMDRTSLYRAVGTMERTGWLAVRAGEDARARIASITAEGRRQLREAESFWADVQTRVIDRFGRRRWRDLVREIAALEAIAVEVGLEAEATAGAGMDG